MATCGHCDKKVKGIRDHIKAVHGDQFYEMGPDHRYYGYSTLKRIHPGLVIDKPQWNVRYSEEIRATWA